MGWFATRLPVRRLVAAPVVSSGSRRLGRALVAGLLAVAAGGAPAPLAAERFELVLDPARTTVGFSLGAVLHTVHGSARLRPGTLQLDTTSGALRGELVVDAQSADTGSRGRDEDMHAKVLLSRVHPTITLTTEQLVGALPAADGTAKVELVASLTLLGTAHPLRFPLTLTRQADTWRAQGSFVVPYVAWGLRDPSKLLLSVDKEVTVTVDAWARATVASPPAPPPAP